MTIEIGKTKITVTLDSAQAKADLEKIKQELKSQEKTAKTVAQKVSRKPSGTGDTTSDTSGTGKASVSVAQKLGQLATARMAGSNRAAGVVSGIAGGQVVKTLAGGSSGISAALGMAAKGAAAYGLASEGTKLASMFTEFLNAAAPNNPFLQGINEGLSVLKMQFVQLESKVISAVKAAATAASVVGGGAAVTGNIGDPIYYYELERQSTDAQRNLDEKFADFRKRSIARALGDGTRRSFNK